MRSTKWATFTKKITPSANKTNALLHSYGQQISVEANYSQKDSYQVTNCQRLETFGRGSIHQNITGHKHVTVDDSWTWQLINSVPSIQNSTRYHKSNVKASFHQCNSVVPHSANWSNSLRFCLPVVRTKLLHGARLCTCTPLGRSKGAPRIIQVHSTDSDLLSNTHLLRSTHLWNLVSIDFHSPSA